MLSSIKLAEFAVNEAEAMQKVNELAEFIDYVRKLRPLRNILEIGGMYGGTMVVWNKIARRPRKLICVDKFVLEGRLEHATKVKFNFVNLDSHTHEAVIAVEDILKGQKLDLLFIDGDHSYQGVKQDFELFSRLVRPKGIIAIHDVSVPHWNTLEHNVIPFWDEIRSEYEHFVVYDAESQADWGGIGVIINDLQTV